MRNIKDVIGALIILVGRYMERRVITYLNIPNQNEVKSMLQVRGYVRSDQITDLVLNGYDVFYEAGFLYIYKEQE